MISWLKIVLIFKDACIKYDKLCVHLSLGQLPTPLRRIASLYSDAQAEFAPPRREREFNREFLAAFSFEPTVDIAIEKRLGSKRASIVTYGLDRTIIQPFVEEMAQRIGFIPDGSQDNLIFDILHEIPVEMATYQMCLGIAENLKVSLEKVFGAVHYMNFLTQYKGVSEREATAIARNKFDLEGLEDILKNR